MGCDPVEGKFPFFHHENITLKIKKKPMEREAAWIFKSNFSNSSLKCEFPWSSEIRGTALTDGASWRDYTYNLGCDDIGGKSGGRSVGGERLAWYWSTLFLQASPRLTLFLVLSLSLARTRCNYMLLRFHRSTRLLLFTPILRGERGALRCCLWARY